MISKDSGLNDNLYHNFVQERRSFETTIFNRQRGSVVQLIMKDHPLGAR